MKALDREIQRLKYSIEDSRKLVELCNRMHWPDTLELVLQSLADKQYKLRLLENLKESH